MAELDALLETTTVERPATGFVFTEGPLWHPDDYYYFADVRSSVFYRLRLGQHVECNTDFHLCSPVTLTPAETGVQMGRHRTDSPLFKPGAGSGFPLSRERRGVVARAPLCLCGENFISL